MKPKVLLQIDHAENPSVFDSIVGIDSGIDHLLHYGGITPIEVESIVHGAIFTRGQQHLKNTALFFGGTKVDRTQELFEQAKRCFFGPLRVSMMCDPNGSNTTAAAAVLCASNHIDWDEQTVTILACTGPVGLRICHLLAKHNLKIQVCSRSFDRAESTCARLLEIHPDANLTPVEVAVSSDAYRVIKDSSVVFAAGAAGVALASNEWTEEGNNIELLIDVNAVPPAGISGVDVTDNATVRHGKTCYGAIGVGDFKMKIHRRALQKLFESNEEILDTFEIFQIGEQLLNK